MRFCRGESQACKEIMTTEICQTIQAVGGFARWEGLQHLDCLPQASPPYAVCCSWSCFCAVPCFLTCGSSQALSHLAHPLSCPWFLPSARLPAVARVCLDMLLPRLLLVYSFGFFSLTSIAYRRVIRVYQYEVGDDLSGRFFSSYFSSSPHCGFTNALWTPRRLLSNPHPSHLGGGSVPLCCTGPGPASCPVPGLPFPGGRILLVSLNYCWGRRKPGALPC